MTKSFLQSFLQGRNSGPFKEWLDSFEGNPRIAWYPSAGHDFRALVYLDPTYKDDPPTRNLPAPPDCFIYTDYLINPNTWINNGGLLYEDTQSKVLAEVIEELPSITLPLHEQLVAFPNSADHAGRVFFLWVRHINDNPGTVEYPVLYVVAENESFCFKRLLPARVGISHVISVRYGYGFGGSRVTGSWLLHVLNRLRCKVFVSDGDHNHPECVNTVFRLFPRYKLTDVPRMEKVRRISGTSRSHYGGVSWNIVHRNRPQKWVR